MVFSRRKADERSGWDYKWRQQWTRPARPMTSQQNLSNLAKLPTVELRLADVDTNDGPQPMRGCKPGTKSANAADQFRSDHLEEVEKRAATPARLDVQQHNKVPRLEEPLKKMAALSKVKTSATVVAKQSSHHHEHRHKNSDNICHQCFKLRQMDRKRRHKDDRSRSRTKKSELKSRVTKSNCRQKTIHMPQISKSRCSLVERKKKCQSRCSLVERKKKCPCRYCMRFTNKGTCTYLVLKEASTLTGIVFERKDPKRVIRDTDGSNTPNGSSKSNYTNSQNSVRSSLPSGSYKSNISHMSLDHEPMVTNED